MPSDGGQTAYRIGMPYSEGYYSISDTAMQVQKKKNAKSRFLRRSALHRDRDFLYMKQQIQKTEAKTQTFSSFMMRSRVRRART